MDSVYFLCFCRQSFFVRSVVIVLGFFEESFDFGDHVAFFFVIRRFGGVLTFVLEVV